LWRSGEWLLHHDNAPAHTALNVRQFLVKNGMTTVPHPLYSPDLAPSDVFLFPRMTRYLKGKCFQNVEEVREKMTEALKAITLQEYQNCFEQWKKLWDKSIASQAEYFEGD
jgi:transposase